MRRYQRRKVSQSISKIGMSVVQNYIVNQTGKQTAAKTRLLQSVSTYWKYGKELNISILLVLKHNIIFFKLSYVYFCYNNTPRI